jgi:septal ring-binding cell division protein DamX
MRDDIVSYLDFRMRAAGYKGPSVFTAAAIKAISKVSLGLTRRINILADKALLAAYSAGTHQVGAPEVNAAIRDSEFSNATRGRVAFGDLRGKWVLPITAALSFVAGATLLAFFSNGASTTTPTAPVVAIVPASPAQAAAGPITVEKTQVVVQSVANPTPLPLPAQASPAENVPPTPVTESPAAPLTPTLALTTTQSADKPEASADPLGQLTRQRIEAWHAWMGQVKNERWFVQLLASDRATAAAIEPFLKRAGAAHLDPEQIRVYGAEVNGGVRYGVIYGEFASRSEASAFIQSLPKALRSGRPYPRQVSQLR